MLCILFSFLNETKKVIDYCFYQACCSNPGQNGKVTLFDVIKPMDAQPMQFEYTTTTPATTTAPSTTAAPFFNVAQDVESASTPYTPSAITRFSFEQTPYPPVQHFPRVTSTTKRTRPVYTANKPTMYDVHTTNTIEGVEADGCWDPNGVPGHCQSVRTCYVILSEYESSRDDRIFIKYLQKSNEICNYEPTQVIFMHNYAQFFTNFNILFHFGFQVCCPKRTHHW